MSLILLFLPHNGVPPVVQGAFTPGVISAIETLKPTLILVETATGEFTPSTIQYSSTADSYNTGFYGGANNPLPEIAVIFSVDTVRPSLVLVEESEGIFVESTETYNGDTI